MSDRPDDWILPENMARQASEGIGVYGAYSAYERGEDAGSIAAHAVVDDAYALRYARNLRALLARLGRPLRGNVLDAGCAIGTITNALGRCLGPDGRAFGLDLSQPAIRVARRRYPACTFEARSCDDLSAYPDGFFDLVHLREFYPFTRSDDASVHLRFLEAFLPKLGTGGAVAAVQVVNRKGLADTFEELSTGCRRPGYDHALRRIVAPLRLYRHTGDAAYRPGIYPIISLAALGIERARPGSLSFLYLFRRKAG